MAEQTPLRARGCGAGAVGLLLLLAGCTAGGTPVTPSAPTTVPQATDPRATDPRDAARATVDAINATARGEVAAQQAVLARLVEPGRAAEQAACAPATITIRLDPALDHLTPIPAPTGADAGAATESGATESDATASASATGDAPRVTGRAGTPEVAVPDGPARYRLPVLIEVFTGGVRTGTDIAGLELTVVDGVAHPAPLCLR